MQYVTRITTTTRWRDDNGYRQRDGHQFVEAFDKRDAIHIARGIPPLHTQSHGQTVSRRADVVMVVHDAKGKRIYLDETTIEAIATQATEPDTELMAAE